MTHRVIIIGGGFGGLEAAFSLSAQQGSFAITLVNAGDFHTFIPSVYEILSGRTSPDSIRIPLGPVLGAAGIGFVRDEALSIDPGNKEVVCRTCRLPYDQVIVATGAENMFFGIPGAEEFTCRFRTAEQAARTGAHAARLLDDPLAPFHAVVAGGGTEGVEAAGELLDLIRSCGRDGDLADGRITLTIIEGRERLLPGFPPAAQERAGECLRGRGALVITGRALVEVKKDSVVLDRGEQLTSTFVLWTGGIQPSRLVRTLPVRKDACGWIMVDDRLCSPDDGDLYAVGDAVSIFRDDEQLPLRRLAYHAEDQARVAAANIALSAAGREKISYSPVPRPQLISIGKAMGLWIRGSEVASGAWVVAMKKAVERAYLMRCLSRPLVRRVTSWIPGMNLFRRLKTGRVG